jgi:Ca2+-binding RTX toxin-like protein
MATIEGARGNDHLTGTAAADRIYAREGDDILKGRSGDDWLFAGVGNDVLTGGAGDDSLLFFSSYDSYEWWRSPIGIGNDVLNGGDGNDLFRSGGGNDKLLGGRGADTLRSGDGVDTVKGGSGDDMLHLDWDDVSFRPGWIYGPGPDTVGLPEKVKFVALRDALISGGGGTDRLVVDFSKLDLDLTAVANDRIRGIEIIDLAEGYPEGYGVKKRLTLNRADILDMSFSTDTLTILGEKGDKVDIVGNFVDEGVSDGFHRYKLGAATLLVDTDINHVG